MGDFSGSEELLADFLQEAAELLADVDNRLVTLEQAPGDRDLLNHIFRGFHTIKGGAGFLHVAPLVNLCHHAESMLDRLRKGEASATPEVMDLILGATAAVRDMFNILEQGRMPEPADEGLLQALQVQASGQAAPAPARAPVQTPAHAEGGPDWQALHAAVTGGGPSAAQPVAAGQKPAAAPSYGRRATDHPDVDVGRGGRREADKLVVTKDSSIRVDTDRLDYVLTLAGEIGLTKNRLTALRNDLLKGRDSVATLRAVDDAVNQLDLMVGNLQNAVMKTRMQPIGRLFRKYPRLVRDLARELGKEVELVLEGEDTEIDKTMIEDLNDPLVHLVRNAVDHGVEKPDVRLAAGKPARGEVRLSARQEGDHIIIEIFDDGRGMNPEVLREKALEKGLITREEANNLDDRQSLSLIFLPGFSTADKVSDVSGRGVGMDVVKTNIGKLNGTVSINSELGSGSRLTVSLPLTLAILPVLVVRLGGQPLALPLSLVREILPIPESGLREVGGHPAMVVRDEVLPVVQLADLLEWPAPRRAELGVLLHIGEAQFVLGVDGFDGRDDVVIKSLESFQPQGVAGATMSSEGEVVLILDMSTLLTRHGKARGVNRLPTRIAAAPVHA